MSFYPPAVRERLNSPLHVGTIPGADAQGTSASFLCGSYTRFSLSIDDNAVIEDAKFTTNGCGFMVAAADTIASWIKNKELADLHGLRDDDLLQVVSRTLDKFPAERVQCSTIVFEALRASLAGYRAQRIDEFRGEKALICTCFGITEDTIIETIEKHNVTDVDEVTSICRAGSGCGSCRMLIAELIDARARF
jgi:NifU-like protein